MNYVGYSISHAGPSHRLPDGLKRQLGRHLGGVFTFGAIWVVFEVLALAIFPSALAAHPGAGASIGMAIWTIILTIIAMYVAGLETGRLSGVATRHDGIIHRIIMFGLSEVSMVILTFFANGMMTVGTAARGGYAINLTAGGGMGNVPRPVAGIVGGDGRGVVGRHPRDHGSQATGAAADSDAACGLAVYLDSNRGCATVRLEPGKPKFDQISGTPVETRTATDVRGDLMHPDGGGGAASPTVRRT